MSPLASELPELLSPEASNISPLVRLNLIYQRNPMWSTFLLDLKSETMYLTPTCLHVEDEEYGMFEVFPT